MRQVPENNYIYPPSPVINNRGGGTKTLLLGIAIGIVLCGLYCAHTGAIPRFFFGLYDAVLPSSCTYR